MSDATPPPTDPISRAAAASVGYTPQMHADVLELVKQQISDIMPRTSHGQVSATHPAILDLYETAIYHLAHTEKPIEALHYYDGKLGGHQYFAGRLGDYRRGLRIAAFLIQSLGADYMDVLACPAHDFNLYRMALGDPIAAEQDTQRLLQNAKERAQIEGDSEADKYNWLNPFRYFRENVGRGFMMYEGIFLQTRCDALTMQGKLRDAQAIMDAVLDQPHEPDKRGRNGSNPYARRALARVLVGNITGAFDDFKQADQFSAEHTHFQIFESRDWHHRTLYAAFLARLGYLSGAQTKLDRMNI